MRRRCTCTVCSGVRFSVTPQAPTLRLGSLAGLMMCVRLIHMHGGLLHLHTCIERLERLVEPGVRVSWGVRRYCSRGFMSTFRACVVVHLHYPELRVSHLQGDGMVVGSLHARLWRARTGWRCFVSSWID
ncbi:hypothetical protein LINGRAHAP2_LOCUS4528 [Linum grandiflorum]